MSTITFGHIYCQQIDSLYVWANPGLNFRQTTDPNSDILELIPFGEKILIDWSESSEDKEIVLRESEKKGTSETPELSLKGRMVKAKYKNQIGFVFSGFLSHFPTFLNEISFVEFLIDEYDTIKTMRYESGYFSDQKIYGNGIISFSYCACTGCSELSVIIPNIHLQEGFLIGYHIFKLGEESTKSNQYWTWKVRKLEEYYIEISGTQELDFLLSIRESSGFTTVVIGSYN